MVPTKLEKGNAISGKMACAWAIVVGVAVVVSSDFSAMYFNGAILTASPPGPAPGRNLPILAV
jgi:hypothetical protein